MHRIAVKKHNYIVMYITSQLHVSAPPGPIRANAILNVRDKLCHHGQTVNTGPPGAHQGQRNPKCKG